MLSSFLAFMLAAVCVLPVTAGVSAAPDNLRGSLTSTSAVYIQDGYLIVSEDMTVEDVKLMFDADVQVVSGNELAGTGAYVTVGDERMDIVLRGDVNGDGKVNEQCWERRRLRARTMRRPATAAAQARARRTI